jgi:hypothetical protein
MLELRSGHLQLRPANQRVTQVSVCVERQQRPAGMAVMCHGGPCSAVHTFVACREVHSAARVLVHDP